MYTCIQRLVGQGNHCLGDCRRQRLNMLMSWVVICALVGYTLGQKTGCCTPDQWEGMVGEIVGVAPRFGRGRIRGGGIKLSYDFTNKKVAETIYLRHRNKTITVGVIIDFNGGKLYRFLPGMKRCKSRAIKATPRRMCVPANATKGASFYYGFGTKKLQVTSYKFVSPKRRFVVDAEMTQVGQKCVPVLELVVGQSRRARYMATVGFANISKGIKDPSVFIPPAYCKSELKYYEETNEDPKDKEMDEFLVQYLHEKIMDTEEFEFE